jgi:hypothetical protein
VRRIRPVVLFALSVVTVAAACRPPFMRRNLQPDPKAPDSLYWRALSQLDAANTNGSTDTALHYLNLYLADGTVQTHRVEATVLRQLTRDALLLARVQAALTTQQKTDTVRVQSTRPVRDEEALKEIQRLKDELAKANEELERIRKRLANPKPPV